MRPNKEFVTDGCSGGMSLIWRKLFDKAPPWEGDCVRHDLHYWIGGSTEDRFSADVMLYHGVQRKGHPIIALGMLLAVRVGGHPALPFAWRWGYGHDHKNYYRNYYDRHHDAYVILEDICKERNIDPLKLFGDRNHD